MLIQRLHDAVGERNRRKRGAAYKKFRRIRNFNAIFAFRPSIGPQRDVGQCWVSSVAIEGPKPQDLRLKRVETLEKGRRNALRTIAMMFLTYRYA